MLVAALLARERLAAAAAAAAAPLAADGRAPRARACSGRTRARSYLALALGLVVYRRAARRAGGSALARRGGRGRRRRARLRQGLPPHRAGDELHRRGARRRRTQSAHAARARARRSSGALGREHREHWQSLRAGDRAGLPPPAGLRPRQRRLDRGADRTSRSSPASRPTPSSASTPASPAACSSSPGRSRCSGACSRSSAWLAAALAAMLALGLQTDIIGVPWLVYVLWTLAGSCVADRREAWTAPRRRLSRPRLGRSVPCG